MPELPEVETTVKSLNILKNKKVINVDIHVKKLRYLVPHLDLKKKINAASWNDQMEGLIKSWCEKAA